MKNYDSNSADSIIDFAKILRGQTLRQACGKEIEEHNYKGKGNFGQILEKFYFGYEPNSDAEPDFKEARLELKSSPLKVLKKGQVRSKERVVLNIINYLEAHQESFEESSFWKKNSHLLFVFYMYSNELDLLDYVIKLVDDWKYPAVDLKVIRRDWEIINQKIKDGKAHELSEGDTFYLGACTKGSTAQKSMRKQPNNVILAKQRAYSLKQGYVNHIIANIADNRTGQYGKIIKEPEFLSNVSLEEFVVKKFEPFYGQSIEAIQTILGVDLNIKAKSYFASLAKVILNTILGVEGQRKIEEFEKADIRVKAIRLREDQLPKEDISFPVFEYNNIVETNWEDSDFKSILESKFFFVFYQFEGEDLVLRKVKFWNMPFSDILEAKEVWDETVSNLKAGKILKKIPEKGKRRSTFFPKKRNHRISHVRPHTNKTTNTFELPFADKLTGETEYTKHCFWLNNTYVRDEIYLK